MTDTDVRELIERLRKIAASISLSSLVPGETASIPHVIDGAAAALERLASPTGEPVAMTTPDPEAIRREVEGQIEDGFQPTDFADALSPLLSGHEAVITAGLSNNLNVIIAALRRASHPVEPDDLIRQLRLDAILVRSSRAVPNGGGRHWTEDVAAHIESAIARLDHRTTPLPQSSGVEMETTADERYYAEQLWPILSGEEHRERCHEGFWIRLLSDVKVLDAAVVSARLAAKVRKEVRSTTVDRLLTAIGFPIGAKDAEGHDLDPLEWIASRPLPQSDRDRIRAEVIEALEFYAEEGRYEYDNDCCFDGPARFNGYDKQDRGLDILQDRGVRAREAIRALSQPAEAKGETKP